jgi:hypothetical protein
VDCFGVRCKPEDARAGLTPIHLFSHGGINSIVELGQTNDQNEGRIPSCRHKVLAVEPFMSRYGKSGLAHRVARCIKSTVIRALAVEPVSMLAEGYAGTSTKSTATITPQKMKNSLRCGVKNHKSPYQLCDNGLTIYHILAQMYVESRGDYRAISHRDCHGPMQVMPATGAEHGYPEWSLTHPVIGMEAGITIMSKLWARFRNVSMPERWKLSLAAYNGGYKRTIMAYYRYGRRWMDGIPAETKLYIKKVLRRYYGR